MEWIDVYDKNRQKLNQVQPRNKPLPKGGYGLVVHGFLFNEEHQLLIQQRSSQKTYWPNLWDVSIGGGVQANETSQSALERELKEELGITLELQQAQPYVTLQSEGIFDDIYLLQWSTTPILFQPSEVQQVRFVTYEELVTLVEEEKFVKINLPFIRYVFDTLGTKGLYTD